MSKKYKYYSGLYYGNLLHHKSRGDTIVFRCCVAPHQFSWEGYTGADWFDFYFDSPYNETTPSSQFTKRDFKPISKQEAEELIFIGSI
tara:strand:+ start:240 stop:503 length:264 start_codon:yes stop_codon:yes gene_type:complete